MVEPCLNKVDLPRLKQDLPKYFSAGVFHDDARLWWEAFISSFESTYGATPTENIWSVDILKGRVPDHAEHNVEPAVPDRIVTIHKNQMEAHPKVFYALNCLWYSEIFLC